MKKLTRIEIQEFYDSPLEPERQRVLARYLQLVAALQNDSADSPLLIEFQQIKQELEGINSRMQADFRELKSAQARVAQRAEELRQQLGYAEVRSE